MVFKKGINNKGKNNPMYGRKHTNQTKIKMSETTKKQVKEGLITGVFKKGEHRSPNTEFKKGMTSWCKGTKGLVKANKGSFKKGNHPNTEFKKGSMGHYKGGTYQNQGYIYIYSPQHPFKNCSNYVAEHRLVMEKHFVRYLTKQEIVHHINTIRNDNRIENLFLFPNAKLHMCYHITKTHKNITEKEFMEWIIND